MNSLKKININKKVNFSSHRFTLLENEVHLWYVLTNEINNPSLIQSYLQLMNQEEKKKGEKFVFPRDKLQHIVTRALVRTALSHYAEIRPEDWEFSFNSFGRPEVVNINLPCQLSFNLSHCKGLILCAISQNNKIGIDVEKMNPHQSILDVAKGSFSEREVSEMNNLAPEFRTRRFYEIWTLKEAYIKARGMGLSLPLELFSFHLAENQPIRTTFDPLMEENDERWQFRLFSLLSGYQSALALEFPKKSPLEIIVRKVIPLEATQQMIFHKNAA